MTSVLLFLALIAFGLAVGIYLVTSWAQAAFYEQVVEQLPARAGVAAAALTLVLALWAFIEAKSPGRFDSLFAYSASDSITFDEFVSERNADGQIVATTFRKRVVPPGRVEFVDAAGKTWRRSDSGVVTAIVVEENGEKKRFIAQLDPDGNFRRDPRDRNKTLDVEYVEEGGRRRVMTETDIGTISSSRIGGFLLNLIFNALILAAWVALLIFALGFDAGRAALLGLIGWLLTLLLLWPPLKTRVETTMKVNSGKVAWNPTPWPSENWSTACSTRA
jgi:hypothetical protein